MRPLGAELAARLAAHGVTHVFGVPGVHNLGLYRGLEAAGLTHILARHEAGAGFMADGYARASGRPGVAFVISGPGLLNILTPLGQAASDSVPLVVLASCLDDDAARIGQLHQMRDQEGAGRAVADWSETPQSAAAAEALLDRAFAEFRLSRPRPKVLNLPIRLLDAPSAGTARRLAPDAALPSPEDGAVEDCARRIASARRPVFVFGGGARHASDTARTVLSRSHAASFTTVAGRGIVDPAAPLHFGPSLARASAETILAAADVIVAVGTELGETDLWRERHGGEGRTVRVDIDPAVLSRIAPGDTGLLADAAAFLNGLARALTDDGDTDWSAGDIARERRRWRAEIAAEHPAVANHCDALAAALPEDTIVFSDMTQFAYAATELWDMPAPDLWHHPSGFGTLGYALPAAVGGALAHDGPVLAIAGDYGIQYTIQELGTAVELGLPLPILVWDNQALGQIRDNMVEAQIAPFAVHARNPDWAGLARAYGAGFAEARSPEETARAAVTALSAPRPTLIRIRAALS